MGALLGLLVGAGVAYWLVLRRRRFTARGEPALVLSAPLIAEVPDFAEERIKPGAAERDRTGEFPHEIFAEMGELGLLGMMVPEAYGGAAVDLLSYLIAVEELARVDAAVAVGMTVTNSV